MMVDEFDAQVRNAAFEFLKTECRRAGSDVLARSVLAKGFEYQGRSVAMLGPQGIFKPAILPEMPLSITTAPVRGDGTAPYPDVVGDDGLLKYCYRGSDAQHHENVGLRLAHQRAVPLIYCHGVVRGQYVVVWPVYIVGDSPEELSFTVSVDEQRFVSIGSIDPASQEAVGRRRYITREVQYRLHQERFRQRVLAAYCQHCAVCSLRHAELLEAAHILPDGHPKGEPVVANGLALCKLHHAAFDLNILGISPDYRVELRTDVLQEKDGPMLRHGLQGFHQTTIWTPGRPSWKPRPEFLEERYAAFKKAS